ncbi:hypothetical protein [Streptomyces sp. CBMA152]|uniref:hypothetical protein n=1 Tax=Streptomyces sp. CBMA152 TaxID=1896312 RepID=UPI0016603B89|nr:hypothetical protein [Streptomyces sp. CBMA152]MBD0742656.1 hypothetical protein [Streptomyces sp. CBMA152]
MQLTAAACAMGSALLVAGPASAHAAPAGGGAHPAAYYQTEMGFGDGSALVTRVDTGQVTTTPARNGSTRSEAARAAADGSVTTTDGRVVEPHTDTPRGYTLQGNNKIDDYHYRSDMGVAKLDRCVNGRCNVEALVRIQMKETLFGGSSRRWAVGLFTQYWAGDPYSFSYDYYCGVNVPNDTDWTCETKDATADGHHSEAPVYASRGTYAYDLNRGFGVNESTRVKFPMVGYHISWPGYSPVVTVKYRGWDVRNYSGTWKLAPATGTGG